jgi:membrane-associated phospholipid phosphatase
MFERIIDLLFYPIIVTIILWNINNAIFLNAFVALLLSIIAFKIVSMKLRPDKSDYMSFPSGHSACAWFIAFTFFDANMYAILWATLVSWSRVALRRHHIEDVLIGILMGAVFSMIVFYEKLKLNHKDIAEQTT